MKNMKKYILMIPMLVSFGYVNASQTLLNALARWNDSQEGLIHNSGWSPEVEKSLQDQFLALQIEEILQSEREEIELLRAQYKKLYGHIILNFMDGRYDDAIEVLELLLDNNKKDLDDFLKAYKRDLLQIMRDQNLIKSEDVTRRLWDLGFNFNE